MIELSANFLYLHDTPEYLYIVDTGTDEKSVTNDAKAVVKFLYDNYELGNKRLIYRDTCGQINEILHNNGKFLDFAPGHKNIPTLPNYDGKVKPAETDLEKLTEKNFCFCSVFVCFSLDSRYFSEPVDVFAKWEYPYLPRVGETVSGWLWIESEHINLSRLYENLSPEGLQYFKQSNLDFVNWLYELSMECDYVRSIGYWQNKNGIYAQLDLSEIPSA
jgi:hypothetical protein